MNDLIIPIILAAGKSDRFGNENKLLFKVDGISIFERTLRPFLGIFKSIVVVVGHESEELFS